SSSVYAGGLVGYSSSSSSSISNSYATGDVYASSASSSYVYAGGLVGVSYSNISNSYATGDVYASSSVFAGGLVGSSGSITNSYYYSGATIDVPSGKTPSSYGTGLTKDQMTGTGTGRADDTMTGFTTDNWTFQDDGNGVKYLPRLKNITYDETTNPAPRFLSPFTASDFDFKVSANLTYDGEPKKAEVTARSEGIGEITVKYYNSAGTNLTSAPTNAGTYTVKIDFVEGDNDAVWRNITADHWTFTIEKAAPTIKSTTTEVTYKHGLTLKDVPFPSTEGGTWAWSDPDTTVIQYAGDRYYPAIFTPDDSDNYATASRLIFVQVGKGELSTDNFTFTPPANNIYNGFGIYPTVKPDNLTGVGDITLKYYKLQVENGKLTIGAPSEEAPTDVGTYGVSINVTEDVNYKLAENLSPDWKTKFESGTSLEELPWTFSILPIEPKDPGIPKANPIVYGNPLSTSVLSVTGWKWVNQDTIPTVGNSGYTAYYSIEGTVGKYDWDEVIKNGGYTFKQAEGSLPDRLEKTIAITVIPAVPKYERPENLKATYGQTLANVALSTLYTGWSWLDENQSVGDVGTHQFKANFTQFKEGTTEADENFETVTDTLNVEVTKADPKCILPENLTATYGDTLGSVLLPKQSESETPGTWKWVDGSQLVGDVTEGGNTFAAIFTPDDSDNYNTRTENLTVTVKKANLEASDFDFKASNAVYDGNEKTATVTLKSDIVGAGEITSVEYYKDGSETPLQGLPTSAGTYKVKINVSEGGNYNKADGLSSTDWTFTITQAPATNPTTPTATAIAYGDKLSNSKLSVDGWKWNEPNKVPNAGTDYYMAYYDVEDDTNYNWLKVDDYVPSKHRVERNIRLTVNPAEPTIPETLSGTFGQTLGEIKIPDAAGGTWSWKNENTRLSEIGEKLFPATFTPKSSNYAEKETDLKVNVNPRPINSKEITISGVKDEYEYDGNTSSIQPEVTVIDKLISSENPLKKDTDYTVSYSSFSWKEDGGAIDGGVTIKGIGNYTGEASKTFKIKDKVLPAGKIILDDNIEFSLFNSKVDFKYMFNEAKTVRIEGSDAETGIKNIYYYISDKDLFASEGEYTNDEIEKTISPNGWNLYDKGTPIELGKGSKNIIYAKIEDNSGNKKYISSQGIIVYDQVEAIVNDVYTKTSKENIEIISDLKGNTIKEIIRNGDTKVEDTNYTINGSKVVLNGSYLESLLAGEHTFTVRYNPMGEEFIENSTEGDKPEDITFTVKVQKAGLKAENFVYTEPEDLLYDEKAKVATVTAKPEFEGIGKITVKYYDSKGNLLPDAPKDVGTYKVRIDVAPSDKYEAQTDIKSNSWNFEVEYLDVGENPYKITISEEDYKQDDSTYWLKDGNSAEISPTGSRYKISTELGKGYTPELKVSSWTPETEIYLQDDDGHMTDAIKVNVNISQDKNSPIGSIKINDRDPWQSLINVITFGLFFKDDEQTVTIKAEDNESGIKEAKYLVLSNDNLIQGATPEEIIAELEGKNGWVSFTGGSKDVTLKEYNKYVVYEKITDNVGHVTYVSSNGIVIYTDSQAEKSEIEYVKETEEDLKLKIFTKGNTIKDIEVKDKENIKRKVNCEVSEVDASTNIITFPWGDLNKLEFGNYTVTITYNPQGVEYNGTGDAPTDSTVNLKVVKNPTVTIDKFDFTPPGDPIYDGKPKEAKVTVKEGVNGVGEITIKYYDSTGTLLEGPPTDVGEYTVKIDVTEGTSYGEVKNLTAENWKFTIKPAFPENPVTPTLKAVKYGTKLSEITLDDGWNWVDDTIETTVESQGYMAYYDVEDYTNYDWSNIEGYNPELHRVERTLKLTVFVDKSDWGEEVKNNDELNYVDKDGTTSTEVVKKDVTWVKEESDGTSAWYGLDNSEGEFELGSRFWVRWLNKEKGKEEWEYYYNNLDEKYKNAVDSGRLWIFLAGVTAPNGQEYEGFNKEVKFYIQLGEDWDKEDINAVFISSGEDEILDVSYVDDISSPAGTQEFARLTLKHFSPYAVYDNLTDEERAALMESENKNEATSDEDNVMYRVWSLFTTGDTATPLLLTGLAVLVIASGATLIFLKKKRKK
ncbi:MAG: X2-like carbohydrate binding domain-containing protein, partial [Clostridia bacterium]|nr:X2-like carbohydrate binding domain-containing protein [Clostridia bacterium]